MVGWFRRTARKALDLLTTRSSIRIQFQMQLFGAHAFAPLECYYDRLFGLKHQPPPVLTNACASECLPAHGRLHRLAFEQDPEATLWDWRGLPREPLEARVYHSISTTWMVYILVKTMASNQLFALISDLTGMRGHCVLLGRLVFHPTMNSTVAFFLANLHLIWRSVQNFAAAPHKYGTHIFLLQSHSDLERFYSQLRDFSAKSTHEQQLQQQQQQQQQQQNERRYSGLVSCRVDFAERQPPTRQVGGQDESTVPIRREAGESLYFQFFHHILCYRVQLNGRTYHKLRPNRTLEAREQLARRMALVMSICSCTLVIIASFVTPIVIFVTLTDLYYTQTYAGCSPDIERLYASRQPSDLFASTLNPHHLCASVMDIIENLALWLDSGLGSAFMPSLTYMLNFDIILYWRHLHARIEHLLEVYKRLEPLRQQEFNVELNELQYEIFDFFQEIRRCHIMIGDVLTTVIFAWLGLCTVFSYSYSKHLSTGVPVAGLLVLFLVMALILGISYHALELHNSCMRSYPLLCSLMALTQDLKLKRRFLKVLDLFNYHSLTTYKIFRKYPYLGTTYLALIGWTASCVLACYVIFGRDTSTRRPHQSQLLEAEVRNKLNGQISLGTVQYSIF